MTQELLSGISRNIGESYSDQKITEKVAQKITDYLLSNQCGTLISDMDMCALSPFGPSWWEHAPEESMSLQDWAGTNTTTVWMNAIATWSQITVTHQQALHILSLVK
jgi:hypothetical protein